MKKYRKLLKKNFQISLDNIDLVNKLFEWFKENPYPQDHSNLHVFAKSLGIEADVLKTYIYAIVSCFISGGNFNNSSKKIEDFDKKEIEMGIKTEMEHVDKNNTNPIIQEICKKIATRIALDHLSEAENYYTELKKIEANF